MKGVLLKRPRTQEVELVGGRFDGLRVALVLALACALGGLVGGGLLLFVVCGVSGLIVSVCEKKGRVYTCTDHAPAPPRAAPPFWPSSWAGPAPGMGVRIYVHLQGLVRCEPRRHAHAPWVSRDGRVRHAHRHIGMAAHLAGRGFGLELRHASHDVHRGLLLACACV